MTGNISTAKKKTRKRTVFSVSTSRPVRIIFRRSPSCAPVDIASGVPTTLKHSTFQGLNKTQLARKGANEGTFPSRHPKPGYRPQTGCNYNIVAKNSLFSFNMHPDAPGNVSKTCSEFPPNGALYSASVCVCLRHHGPAMLNRAIFPGFPGPQLIPTVVHWSRTKLGLGLIRSASFDSRED